MKTSEKEPRNSLVIAGALREQIERQKRVDGARYGINRLEELITELEASLTREMFQHSLAVQK